MTQVNLHKYIYIKSSKKVCLGTVVISETRQEPTIDINNFLFPVIILCYLCPQLAFGLLVIILCILFLSTVDLQNISFRYTNNSIPCGVPYPVMVLPVFDCCCPLLMSPTIDGSCKAF